jgi:hypothetical protein
MNYLNYIKENKINTYSELRKHFMAEPFKFSVYDKDDLAIISYNQTKKYDEKLLGIVEECNGLIISKEKINDIKCYGLKKCEEVFYENPKEDLVINTKLPKDFTTCNIHELIDGTLIKLFHHNNTWKVATSGMIDAYKSFWNNGKLSFGDMFDHCANYFNFDSTKLNKECSYVFLMCHPNNKIVTYHKTPELYHIYTRNNKTFEEVNDDIGVSKPQYYRFDSLEHLSNELKDLEYYIPGFMVYTDEGKRINIKSPNYLYVKSLKDNTQDMFGQIFKLKQKELLNEFLYYYPEYTKMVDYVERRFNNLCKEVHGEYVMKNIMKYKIKPKFHITLNELHKKYTETKEKITFKEVRDHLIKYEAKKLSFLIKNYDF